MSGFVVGFFGAVAGGVLASVVANWLENRFRLPANRHPDDPIENLPSWLAVKIGAISVVCGWFCIVAILMLATWSLVSERLFDRGASEYIDRLIVLGLGVFVGVAFLYLSIAFTVRCPRCRQHVFVQWIRKPPFSEAVDGFNAWSAVAVNILLRGRFRCMYCGQRYSAAPNNPVQRMGSARR